jgi:hypothetical protein
VSEHAFRETRHTARKRHKHNCDGCYLPILPGDRYVTWGCAGDGIMWRQRLHVVCAVQMEASDCLYGEDFVLGALGGDYVDHATCDPEWLEWYAQRRALVEREEAEP